MTQSLEEKQATLGFKGDRPLFTSLGMCILDDLYFPNGETNSRILGGSGVYSILGARLFFPGGNANRLSWLIRAGNAFPKEIDDRLQSWDTNLIVERSEGNEVECTRGELRYFRGENGEGGGDVDFESKIYKYITGPYRIEPRHLKIYPHLLDSSTYHFLTSPLDTLAQVPELLKLRNQSDIQRGPLIIWEPLPPSCKFSELENLMNAIAVVDIFSPNHIELAQFFGLDISTLTFSRSLIEGLGNKVLGRGIGRDNKGTVIIRCGPEGCCIWYRKQSKWVWIEPYWIGEGKKRVVDATGAGNAFLGGFVVGWERSGGDEVLGCVFGGVSAGLVCESIGVPILKRRNTFDGDNCETWNGVDVKKRLEEYWQRLVGKGLVEGDLGSRVWK
ncbi:hypothetical protein DSL72_004327 [Monilinia vaccinii-corymbosi]|uniref:Carbohydrate kinase PfkB domain-containing protein n=1 Tax=Monilinia vaccinii-corymbosi TaxID=61207 RepID=A0A8A3P8P6_9HELO|nr:hypothetical protein DSL72_004327 [Monilinia vaccinii-corymbosi]